MVHRIMIPAVVHILIPGICECHLTWQEDFVDVIKLSILRWGDYLGLSDSPCVESEGHNKILNLKEKKQCTLFFFWP